MVDLKQLELELKWSESYTFDQMYDMGNIIDAAREYLLMMKAEKNRKAALERYYLQLPPDPDIEEILEYHSPEDQWETRKY